MSIHIYDALVDIEQRLEQVLADVRVVKEQAFYAYEASSDRTNETNKQ